VASFVAREYKDRETKLWTNRGAEETRLSLRGAVRDEAISVFGQGLLRSVRHDTLPLCHAVKALSYSPYAFALSPFSRKAGCWDLLGTLDPGPEINRKGRLCDFEEREETPAPFLG
jgi:hypothetical protein